MFSVRDNALVCKFNDETLILKPWGADSIRAVARLMDEPDFPDWALLPVDPVESVIEFDNEEKKASIAVGKIRADLAFGRGTVSITYTKDDGKVLLSEARYPGCFLRAGREFVSTGDDGFRLSVQFAGSYADGEVEKLFGMGQYQQDFLDLKGCHLELAHRNAQSSVPFVLSSRGYGFLWHNPAIGNVTFGKNETVWTSRSTHQMDYWITAGDSPAEILGKYTAAVGRAPKMPEYGLGYWQCKLRYWNQEQVLKVARGYRDRGIPLDVIVIDFFHWPHLGDFCFDPEFFPDPKAMCDELHAMGTKVMVSVWPQIGHDSVNFQEMRRKGYLVRCDRGVNVQMLCGGPSVFYDATNPEARSYVWEKCKQNYRDVGVDFFWLDEAEPEFNSYSYESYRYHTGTVLRTGNIFPQMYSRGFYEGMKADGDEAVVNLVRCAWAASARYGALVWSGDVHCDFETLRNQLCIGLSAGIAGLPWWSCDLGGFTGGDINDPAFIELLLRWFAWGAFSPVMRMHGNRRPYEQVIGPSGKVGFSSGNDNEVWSFGEEAEKILTAYIHMRNRMRDYTRRLTEEATEFGHPMMRTMFYEFPDQEKAWELNDQYMYGPDVLCAPVMYAGVTSRKVWLPAGHTWTDLHTGRVYEGGQTVEIDAPVSYMPVLLKDGSHPDWIGLI